MPQEAERCIFHSQRKVFFNGELVNNVEFLKEGTDPLLLGITGTMRVVLFTVQKDLTTRSRIRAGQDLDQGGFPRAILTHQAMDGISLYVETDIVDCPYTREIL